jgi:hypothetical protein
VLFLPAPVNDFVSVISFALRAMIQVANEQMHITMIGPQGNGEVASAFAINRAGSSASASQRHRLTGATG